MGAWGYGIRQDDFVCDVIGVFEDLLKAGKSVREAAEAVTSKFTAEIKDAEDGPLFWLALADMQWTYGELDPQILNRVKEDLDSGRSLALGPKTSVGLRAGGLHSKSSSAKSANQTGDRRNHRKS